MRTFTLFQEGVRHKDVNLSEFHLLILRTYVLAPWKCKCAIQLPKHKFFGPSNRLRVQKSGGIKFDYFGHE